jgi:hypothetical protein
MNKIDSFGLDIENLKKDLETYAETVRKDFSMVE